MATAAAAAANEEVLQSGSIEEEWRLTVPMLQESLLHVLLMNPTSLLEYLIPRSNWNGEPLKGDEICLVNHLRKNSIWTTAQPLPVSIVEEQQEETVSDTIFQRLERILFHKQPHHIVWLMIAIMDIEVSVYAMVAGTFPGPAEAFEKIFAYLAGKLRDVIRSPFYPCSAGKIMQAFHNEVYRTVCYGNMRRIEVECLPKLEKTSCPRSATSKKKGKRGRWATTGGSGGSAAAAAATTKVVEEEEDVQERADNAMALVGDDIDDENEFLM